MTLTMKSPFRRRSGVRRDLRGPLSQMPVRVVALTRLRGMCPKRCGRGQSGRGAPLSAVPRGSPFENGSQR
jgi:hypothetical protein